jgi:hypothetical protein
MIGKYLHLRHRHHRLLLNHRSHHSPHRQSNFPRSHYRILLRHRNPIRLLRSQRLNARRKFFPMGNDMKTLAA